LQGGTDFADGGDLVMLLVVLGKLGETRTAFCGTVMNITVEADKQTKGKLL
jgi:hypothetical protein